MVFKRIYELLFLAFYRWSVKVNGERNFHVLFATLMLGFVLLLNVAAVLLILEVTTSFEVLEKFANLPRIAIVAGSATFFAAHYGYFRSGKRYVRVLDRHACGAEVLSGPRILMVSCYVVGSFLLLVGMLLFMPRPA